MRFFYIKLFALVVMLLCSVFGQAKAGETARHRVVLVVCDRLTWEDVNADCPFLVSLMDHSAIGLMNTTVDPGPQNATSATLALALGRQPAPPDGHDIVHLNSVALTRRHILDQGLGAALSSATPPRRILVCGNADTDVPARRAALLALDSLGSKGTATGDVALVSREEKIRPFGLSDATSVLARYAATTDADVFVVVLGDLARVEEAKRALKTTSAYHLARQDALHRLDTFFVQLLAVRHLDTSQVDCLLVSPCPPAVLQPSAALDSEVWEQLTPILALGPDFEPGLLASTTTRTVGLVASLDLAPTILHLLGVSVPSGMVGHPMLSQPAPSVGGVSAFEARQQYISRLDFVTTLNAQVRAKSITILIICCLALTLAALLAYWRSGKSAGRWLAPGLICLLNWPVGCLLAPILIPPTLLEYTLRIAAWMATLTAASYLLARALRTTPFAAGGLLNMGIVIFDLLRGQPLLRDSLLSEFSLSGHHRYGAGSVNAVILVGYALIGGFGFYWLKKKQRPSAPCHTLQKWRLEK